MGAVAITAIVLNAVTNTRINGLSAINFVGLNSTAGETGQAVTPLGNGVYTLAFDDTLTGPITCEVAGYEPNTVDWTNQAEITFAMQSATTTTANYAPVLNVSVSGNTVTATANIPQPPGVNYALLIVWGDNGTNSETLAYNSPSGTKTHTYASPGGYQVQAFTEYGNTAAGSSIIVVNIIQAQLAIKTSDGRHYLTAVNGGGLGEPSGIALNTNAQTAGAWETFKIVVLSGGPYFGSPNTTFAIQTSGGNYVTAVNGGGIGGPNDASSPIHADATTIGPWEKFTFNVTNPTAPGQYEPIVNIQTLSGDYLTAVNGGGIGGLNNIPIHTDAKTAGQWETFSVVPISS